MRIRRIKVPAKANTADNEPAMHQVRPTGVSLAFSSSGAGTLGVSCKVPPELGFKKVTASTDTPANEGVWPRAELKLLAASPDAAMIVLAVRPFVLGTVILYHTSNVSEVCEVESAISCSSRVAGSIPWSSKGDDGGLCHGDNDNRLTTEIFKISTAEDSMSREVARPVTKTCLARSDSRSEASEEPLETVASKDPEKTSLSSS